MDPLPSGSACVISVARYDDAELYRRLSARYSATADWYNHAPADVDRWFAAAGLRVARRHAGDVRAWPMTAPDGHQAAYVLGGVGLKD
jgi:hypothetical protein